MILLTRNLRETNMTNKSTQSGEQKQIRRPIRTGVFPLYMTQRDHRQKGRIS